MRLNRCIQPIIWPENKNSPQSWNKPPRIQPYVSISISNLHIKYHHLLIQLSEKQLLLDLLRISPRLSFRLLPRPFEMGENHIPRRKLRHLRGEPRRDKVWQGIGLPGGICHFFGGGWFHEWKWCEVNIHGYLIFSLLIAIDGYEFTQVSKISASSSSTWRCLRMGAARNYLTAASSSVFSRGFQTHWSTQIWSHVIPITFPIFSLYGHYSWCVSSIYRQPTSCDDLLVYLWGDYHIIMHNYII